MTTTSRPSLPALTGLRFVAAIYVVLYHLRPDHSFPARFHRSNIIGAGYVGVSLFFVLSGFILTYNYAPRPDQSSLNVRAFASARFARIYPLYLLGLLIELPRFVQLELQQHGTSIHRISDSVGVVGSSILMIQAWQPLLAYRFNWPSWSVSAEAFFYLVFPAVLGFVCSKRVRRSWPLAVGVLWIVSLSMVMGVEALSHTSRVSAWYSAYDWLSVFYYLPLLRLPEFVMGMIFGAVVAHQSIQTPRWLFPAVVFGTLLVLAGFPMFSDPLMRTGLMSPLFGLLVLSLATTRSVAAQILGSPPLVRLGEASFGMYILHVPIHTILRGIDVYAHSGIYGGPGWGYLYIFVLTGSSLMTLEYIEEPMRTYLRRRLNPTRQQRIKTGEGEYGYQS